MSNYVFGLKEIRLVTPTFAKDLRTKTMKAQVLLKVWIVALLFGMATTSFAQSNSDQVKTLFVFNFTRYIQWPDKSGEIKIGILGNDADIFKAFQTMAAKKSTASSKITVVQFSNPTEAANYQMVYIPENNSNALAATGDLKNTLIITEKDGLAKKGSCINFITENGKIRFEINKSRVDNSNLKISNQLMGLAILV